MSAADKSRTNRPNSRNTPRAASGGDRAAKPAEPGSSVAASLVGFVVAALAAGAFAWASGCHGSDDGHAAESLPSRATELPAPVAPPARVEPTAPAPVTPAPSVSASAAAPEDDKPYAGPLLGALAVQTPVYERADVSSKRIGYIRLGSRVPVDPKLVKTASTKCKEGWYHLLDGGWVCGRSATIDMQSAVLKLGITAPNLDELLPYKYAYNTGHGTPLYRSVPSKDDMIRYEPYLDAAKKARKKAEKEAEREAEAKAKASPEGEEPLPGGSVPSNDEPKVPASSGDDRAAALAQAAALGLGDAGAPEPEEVVDDTPWWQRKHDPEKPLSVTLADLDKDSDDVVAKRMVKGFFVAVDKTFGWNGRTWYKTTGGLVAPSDRMYLVKPPTSQGIEVPQGVTQVGFVLASKAQKYDVDVDGKKAKATGPAPRFLAVPLTGESATVKSTVYRKTSEGWWMKAIDGTYAEGGAPPEGVGAGEKWVDVSLSRKTLVAMEGERPIYAALVSTGKRSKIKKKNHATIEGVFKIREKHITATMDGDGTAAGDLPYSIEDVPFVAYFEGSYALHAAFWHSNFGREMSHGCVNLSPLDAKWMFYWVGPTLPRGWHGVWSSADNKGSTVYVHE
jgi:hypothetical protein